jgi:hypothetical protein
MLAFTTSATKKCWSAMNWPRLVDLVSAMAWGTDVSTFFFGDLTPPVALPGPTPSLGRPYPRLRHPAAWGQDPAALY